MKPYTIRKSPVTLKEYGRCEEVRIYPFGLKKLGFVIGYNPIAEPKKSVEKQIHDLEKKAMFIELNQRNFFNKKASIASDQIADMYEYNFFHNNQNH